MGDINLPFEAGDRFELDLDAAMLSGGVVVMAVVLPTDPPAPGVVFRFAKVDGSGFWPPVVLACDLRSDLLALPPLVRQAVAAAVAGAPL